MFTLLRPLTLLASLAASAFLATSCDRSERPTPAPTSAQKAPATPPAPAIETSEMKPTSPTNPATAKVTHTDEEWKKMLTPEQYNVLREKGTERAFSGKYWDTKTPGVYKCAACGAVLFSSDAKFDSGCGWPSFDKMLADGAIVEHTDTSFGMSRTEVTCARCGGHLGHVFDDGPTSTHLRYCINSASIDLETEKKPADPKPQGK